MRKFSFLALLGLSLCMTNLHAQNYIGAGNNSGITVTSSSQSNDSNWPKAANANNTVNGEGLDAKYMDASRFLSQASMGYDKAHIDQVANMGIEAWIDNQMSLPQTLILPGTDDIYAQVTNAMSAQGVTRDDSDFRPRWRYFNYSWWNEMMENNDLLRHRVAYALTEIFVVSRKSDLSNYGDGLASYYDMLAKHAFGNFEDLLLDVSLHPCMGEYLSHLNNPKADPESNVHPDENYAREVMQLFSIGLYELNADGTRMKDSDGNDIPTYGQEDIRQLAKVFTGLSVSAIYLPYQGNNSLYFGKGLWTADNTKPMMMYEWAHETAEKQLLKGLTLPAGQPGMKDIRDAIHNLVQHPNSGPFISYRLIQRLVKSNPSPEYVERVVNVFNNNGNGVKGDLAAVVKAILLDAEARACSFLSDDDNSRLKEPLVKYMHFARAADKSGPFDRQWNINWNFDYWVKQDIMNAPSVFNFYLPDHMPNGDIAEQQMVAPEFNLHNTLTAPGYMNEVHRWIVSWGELMTTWESNFFSDHKTLFDINYYLELAKDPETFINELDRVFTHGSLSEATRGILKNTLDQLGPAQTSSYLEYRVRLGVYLILISPDFAVMR